MSNPILIFALGALIPILLGSALRIVQGARLRLFFVSQDVAVEDQALIPITSELKRISVWRTLTGGTWRESIELSLRDYTSKEYKFEITYHLWWRFRVQLKTAPGQVRLQKHALQPGQMISVRKGQVLAIGDRSFMVWTTPREGQAFIRETLTSARAA